jgi:hypothetical protein
MHQMIHVLVRWNPLKNGNKSIKKIAILTTINSANN